MPASPIRQVLTSRQAGCAWPQSSARASLWICGQHKSVAHKPTGPTATADNLNVEISPIRTTPGSPSKAALKVTRHGCFNHLYRRLYAGPDSHSQVPRGTGFLPVMARATRAKLRQVLRAFHRVACAAGKISATRRKGKAFLPEIVVCRRRSLSALGQGRCRCRGCISGRWPRCVFAARWAACP